MHKILHKRTFCRFFLKVTSHSPKSITYSLTPPTPFNVRYTSTFFPSQNKEMCRCCTSIFCMLWKRIISKWSKLNQWHNSRILMWRKKLYWHALINWKNINSVWMISRPQSGTKHFFSYNALKAIFKNRYPLYFQFTKLWTLQE